MNLEELSATDYSRLLKQVLPRKQRNRELDRACAHIWSDVHNREGMKSLWVKNAL